MHWEHQYNTTPSPLLHSVSSDYILPTSANCTSGCSTPSNHRNDRPLRTSVFHMPFAQQQQQQQHDSSGTDKAVDELLKHLVVPEQNDSSTPTNRRTCSAETIAAENSVLLSKSELTPHSTTREPTSYQHGNMLTFDDAAPELQSIEDWEKEHPPPSPTVNASPSQPISNGSGPATVITFHELCTKLGLRAEFTLPEVSLQSFSGKTVIGGHAVELPGPFASKKEAKEQVCKAALPFLRDLEQTSVAEERERLKAAQVGPSSRFSKDELGAEDWVSILMNYLQKHRLPYAEYEDFHTETTPFYFAYTVRFQGCPSEPLGAADDFYPTKKDAKRAAARDAVLWLRNAGKVDRAYGSPLTDRLTSITNNSIDPDIPQHSQATLLRTTADAPNNHKDTASLPQQVNEIVSSLGLIQPQFEVQNVDSTLDSLINMTVKFHERDIKFDPRLAREICVKNVYGKKKAKEACCQDVLLLLDEVKRARGS